MLLFTALTVQAAPAFLERLKAPQEGVEDELVEETVAEPEPLPIRPLPDVGVRYPDEAITSGPGSLWADTQASDLLGMEASARQVGDLVTVYIVESYAGDSGTSTSTGRTKSRNSRIGNLLGLETSILNANPNMGAVSGEIGLEWGSEAGFDGGGTTGTNGSVAAVVTCEVVEVMPNGNLRIYGTKELDINKNASFITLQALAQPQDIQLDNTITSERLARLNLEILPKGHVGERARPGVATRAADVAFPF